MNARHPVGEDEDLARLRVPPHSVEAEQSLLGGLLIDNLSWERIADLVLAGDFYRHEHRDMFQAVGRLINSNRPADVVTVFDELVLQGKAESCGGLAYLNAVAQSVPSAANSRHYAQIVRDRSLLRRVVSVGDEIITTAMNPESRNASEVIDYAQAKIFAVGEDSYRAQQGPQGVEELLPAFLEKLDQLAEAGGQEVTGVRTGFADLDKMTSGLQPQDLIVLAARPSMGKTSLAMNIAEHVAIKEGLAVLVYSMEMGSAQLMQRMVGSIGRVDQTHLRTGQLDQNEWSRTSEAVEALGRARLYIDETPGLSPSEVRARARRQARMSGGLGLIVIDYLQLMSGNIEGASGDENRATVLGDISRGLKGLAKELKCPVIALSQLNRGVESRPDKRPLMSDLRDSGAIEQDADVVMFIYRDEYYTKDASLEPGVAEVILAKHRNGPVGTVRLAFNAPHTRFDNLTPRYAAS